MDVQAPQNAEKWKMRCRKSRIKGKKWMCRHRKKQKSRKCGAESEECRARSKCAGTVKSRKVENAVPEEQNAGREVNVQALQKAKKWKIRCRGSTKGNKKRE